MNITNLNRDYLIKINVKEATIDVPKMTFWNTDKKTSNMFVQLVINMSENELIKNYVTIENATDYKITLNVIKPKTNQYRTFEAKLLNEEKALFEIDLPDEFTDQVGEYSFEFEVSSKVDSNDESITTSNGTYKVNGSILTNLNQEISSSPDLPILKQLIEQVKSLQGGDLTGYQKKSDNSLETTSKEVVGAINEVNSQYKDIAKQIESGTATVPNNVVLFQDNDSTETTEDYIPLLSSNGTEYRLTINDNGVPIIKDSSNTIIFTCGTGSGGSSGGDIPTTPDNPGEVTSGVPYTFEWTDGKYINSENGKEVEYEGYSTSQYVSVVGMDFLLFDNGSNGDQPYNCFYGVNKNFVSKISCSHNAKTCIEVPGNACYARFSWDTGSKDVIKITPFVFTTKTWTNGVAYNLNLQANKYINAGGTIINYTGWSMTDYLECGKVSKLSITGNTAESSYCVFFTPDKKVLQPFKITTDNPCEIPVPYGACYFVISNTTTAMDSMTVTPIA